MSFRAIGSRISLGMVHRQLQHRFPNALWSGDPQRHEIALTFDDGPDPVATPELLALLEHYGVKATFFHIGKRAANAIDCVKQVIAAGHQIGLHGYVHESFLLKRSTTLAAELALAQSVLANATGQPVSNFAAVRPPYGHFSPALLRNLNQWGYQPVMWNLVPFHWLQSAQMTIQQVTKGVGNGAIVVLHENLPGPPVLELTAAVLPHLVADGYRFVTVNEMIANLQLRQSVQCED